MGPAGLVVQPGRPEEMSSALETALTWPPAEWHRRSQAARARIQQNFDLDRVVAQLESMYLNLSVQPAAREWPGPSFGFEEG